MVRDTILQLYTTFKKPLLYLLGGIAVVLLIIPIGTYIFFAQTLTSKEAIMNNNDKGVILTDRNDKPFFTFYQAKEREFVSLAKIPISLQHAAIASEDREFYLHPGFSIKGIIRAFVTNLAHQDIRSGGSTITQQLVKNALLSPKQSYFRKYQEIVLAFEIERRYTKQEILEMYLNSVYFGEGAFGVQQAANIYFNKNVDQLSLGESSLLVALLPAPSALSPISGNAQLAKQRQRLVLNDMIEQKYITQAQADAAFQQKLSFSPANEETNTLAPHFALMVKDELIKKYGEEYVARSGFKVKTTLDLDWQQYAENAVANQVAALSGDNVSNGGAIAIDPTNGEVRVLVGSKDWFNKEIGKFNVVTALRQPGSSFKPIVYAKAFETRTITSGTILRDEPTTFPGNYKPLDYDRKFRGKVLPRRALANSLNIPAVEVMSMIGVDSALEMAQRLGISTLTDRSRYGLALVLGGGEVKLLELTDAYATFANKGTYNKTTLIEQITDKKNNVIYTYTPQPTTILDEGVAYIISSILSDNSARAEEFGGSLTIPYKAAVKTGTTDDYRDAWTVGYTPNLAVGVWVGNNDNSPMDQIAGSLGAAPIWKSMMTHYLAQLPLVPFVKPVDVVSEAICREKGLKIKEATSSASLEYFLSGTEPTQYCFDVTNTTGIPFPSTSISPSPTNEPSGTPQPTPTERPTPTLIPTIVKPTIIITP